MTQRNIIRKLGSKLPAGAISAPTCLASTGGPCTSALRLRCYSTVPWPFFPTVICSWALPGWPSSSPSTLKLCPCTALTSNRKWVHMHTWYRKLRLMPGIICHDNSSGLFVVVDTLKLWSKKCDSFPQAVYSWEPLTLPPKAWTTGTCHSQPAFTSLLWI